MSFYEFRQNNSGGSFDIDPDRGLSTYVIVEADNAFQANKIAQGLGIYFNGCESGYDCDCCGDRWGEAYGPGDEVPSHYGRPLRLSMEHPTKEEDSWFIKWAGKNPEVYVHYKDGRIVGYNS